jgi:hypothetical protein
MRATRQWPDGLGLSRYLLRVAEASDGRTRPEKGNTMPEAIKIEDLKVGDKLPVDALLKGPFCFPVYTDTGWDWIKMDCDIPVGALASPAD